MNRITTAEDPVVSSSEEKRREVEEG